MGGLWIEPALATGQGTLDQLLRGLAVHLEILRQARRGFHQCRLRLPVAHQVLETGHRVGLGGIGRDACRVQDGVGLLVGAQPDRKHRFVALAARACRHRAGHRPCRLHRRGEGGGHVDHQQGIVAGVGQQRLDRTGIAFTIGIDHQVHRVGVRGAIGQQLGQCLLGRRRQCGQLALEHGQAVGGQAADAAAVADNGQAPAGKGATEPAQGLGGGEQLVQRADPQQAGAVERGGVDRIAAGQRLHMGVIAARGCAAAAASGFDQHHRFGTRGRARGGHELACIADVFHIQQDRAGAVIGGEVIQQVGKIDIQAVAQRNHRREPDRTRYPPLHQRRGNRAGFGNQRQVTGLRGVRGNGSVQARMRGNHPQAMRAEDAQAVRTRAAVQPLRQRTRALAQAGGEDDRRGHPQLGCLGHQLRHDRCRCGDHHQLGHPAQVAQTAHGGDAVDMRMAWIDPADLAGKAAFAQVAHHRPPGRTWTGAAADDRNRLRTEDRLQVIDAHPGMPCLKTP